MALSLKVWLEQENVVKTMKFGQAMSIAEVQKEIRERTESGGMDHGIFLPGDEEKGEPGIWLRGDKVLGFYDVQSGATIHYKKKHRARKVRFLDDSLKTRLLDESSTVAELVEQIGEGEGIPNAEEFGLQIEGTERWLEAQKTLQENFVKDDDVLVLARKFWFSDANCSLDSPKELHLLYVQAKGMVLRGILPTNREQALDIGALELQIRHGNFDPEKVKKKGWFDPVEYLPKPLYKKKKHIPDLEKDVAKEWKKRVGLTELNAKYRLLQTCRALPTWGITYWTVEEKIVTKKNAPPKWNPIRLGITRKNILIMDDKTFEILREWPFIKIKRWSASDTSFSIDFGDWEDELFTCRTRQGGEISAQLAGYIDIILKNKRQAPNVRPDDDAAIAKVSNIVVTRGHAGKARTGVTAAGNDMRSVDGTMGDGEQQYGLIPGQGPHTFGIPGLDQEMVDGLGVEGAAHISDLDSAISGIDGFLANLGTPLRSAALPQNMMVEDLRQRFTESCVSARRAALGLLDTGARGRMDRNFLNDQAKKMALDVGAAIAAAKLAAASDDQDISLLPGAYAISEAIAKVLQVSRDIADGADVDPQMSVWISQQAFKAAEICMACAQKGYLSDTASKDLIMESSRCVAEAAQALRSVSDEGAGSDADLLRKGRNVEALADHAFFTARALSGTMIHQDPQKLVEGAVTQLHTACGQLLMRHREVNQDQALLGRLTMAGRVTNDSMSALLAAAKQASLVTEDFNDLAQQGELLAQHCSVLMSQKADAQEIKSSYHGVAGAANRMRSQAVLLAAKSDDELKGKLVNAARNLANQTVALNAIVKEAAENPRNFQLQKRLAHEAGLLQGVAQEMANEGQRQAAMFTLRHYAKMTAASSLSLSSKARLVPCSDPGARQNLLQNAQRVSQVTGNLITSISNSTNDPLSSATQATIIGQGKEMTSADASLIAVIKKNGNAISDLSKKMDILKCADELQKSMKDLLDASERCEDFAGGKEAKEAMQGMDALIADLDAAEMASGTGAQIFTVHSGIPLAQLAQMIETSYREFQGSKAVLEQASSNPDMIGSASLQYQRSLTGFTDVAKSMAALESDKKIQREILRVAKVLVGSSVEHVNSAKRVSVSPGDAALVQSMNFQGSKVLTDLDTVLDVARGLDLGVLDEAIRAIAFSAQRTKQDFTPTDEFPKYRGDVLEQIEAVSSAAENVATAGESNLRALPQTLPVLTHALDELITAVVGASVTVKDPESKPELLRAGVGLATGTVHVLQAVKAIAGGAGNTQLLVARERVANAVANMNNAANPSKVVLEQALERVQRAMAALEGTYDSFSKTPLLDISEGARSLSTSTSTLLTDVRDDPTQFGRVAQEMAKATEVIVNGSRVAADPGATDYSFAAQKMIDDCNVILVEKDFTKLAEAAKDIGLRSADVVNMVGMDQSQLGQTLKPFRKPLAASSMDVYRKIQNVVRRSPGAQDALMATVTRLAQFLQDLKARSMTGKTSNPAMTAKLLSNAQEVTLTTEDLLVKSLHVSKSPKDSVAVNDLFRTANSLSKGLQELLESISGMAPGAQETAQTVDNIQGSIQKLQVLSLNAVGGKLERSSENKGACQERVIAASRQLTADITKLVKDTVENQDAIGPSSFAVARTLAELVASTEALAATSNTPKQQAETIDMSKGAADSSLQVVFAVRNSAANPYDQEALAQLSESAQTLRNSISEIVMNLQGDFVAQQEVDQALTVIRATHSSIAKTRAAAPYHVMRKNINSSAIDLLTSLNNLSQMAQNNPDQIGMASKEISEQVVPLVKNLCGTAGDTSDPAISNEIIQSTKGTIAGVMEAVQTSKELAGDRQNHALQHQVAQSVNKVTQQVMQLQESVKKGDVSERTMDEAVRKIRATASTLESAGLMASAGQFEMDLDPQKTLADYHQLLVQSSKTLRGTCSEVFLNASGSINDLAASVTKMADAMQSLGEISRMNAALMPDSFSQQAMISGAKAITISCQQLVLASKDANTRPDDPKAEKVLNISNKATDEGIAQLMDVANKASADIVENIKKIDSSRGRITKGYNEFSQASYTGNTKATPQDIVVNARQVAKMSAQVVASISSSSEMVMEAVEDITTGVVGLFGDSQGCSRLTNDPEVMRGLKLSVRDVTQVSLALLDAVKQFRSDRPETHQQVSNMSNRLADTIMGLVGSARKLPGGQDLELEESDLESVALKELDSVARKISEATQKLLDMQQPRSGIDERSHTIHVALLSAAHAVGQAAMILIQAATSAQRELIQQGRASKIPSPYKKDPAWAQGLISAAHEVAGTVEDLVSCSNNSVNGGGEEGVVAAVRMVGGATARLVNASRVKVDPNSPSQKKLETAAKGVTKCTRELADAARKATEQKEETKVADKKFSGGVAAKIAWELQAQTEIAKLEMELEGARRRMFKQRKMQYQK